MRIELDVNGHRHHLGAGEAPIMDMAPAIGAATYEATGIRPRSMPMARAGLQAEVEAQPSR